MSLEHVKKIMQRNDHIDYENEISVTTLCDSPQVRYLKRQNKEEIDKMIAADPVKHQYNSFIGRAIHAFIAEAEADLICEHTLHVEFGGMKIFGTPDAVDVAKRKLYDYKSCKVWGILGGEAKREWVNQLNFYRWLLGKKEIEIEKMFTTCLILDWSKREAESDTQGKYPPAPLVEIEVPNWLEVYKRKTDEEIVQLFINRHNAKPETFKCTDKEVWRKEDVYACMKEGAKRSSKNFDNEAGALEYCKTNSGHSVVKRPGVATRCQDYCVCSKFCPQWAAEQAAKKEGK